MKNTFRFFIFVFILLAYPQHAIASGEVLQADYSTGYAIPFRSGIPVNGTVVQAGANNVLEAHSHVTQHQESQHAVIQQQRVRVTRPAWLCLSEWKRLKLTTEVTDELSDTLRILSDKNPDFAALSKAVRDSVAIMDQCLWGLRKVLEQRDFSANNHDLWSTMLACTRTEDRKIKKKLMEDASEALVMLSAHQTRGPSGFNNAFCVVQTYVHQANQVVEHNDKLYAAIKSNTHARAGRHDAKVRAGEA